MSDAKTSQYTLEEGVGRLQDGVEGLFTKASTTGDDFGAPKGVPLWKLCATML
ncbi:hypothetical protein AcetOrient_orf05052 [Acetobacter orientalis]|uniref:Uncharacterized protein n=1 Tax=Acetobacter orientalis TaxID=146474 RepID=A0A2Z5ZM48_9PROT|nr:hypothetical protein AcetOrient_orf05052 [Acetobacter orientalis]